MTAIALIAGFALGAGCAVALLLCLRLAWGGASHSKVGSADTPSEGMESGEAHRPIDRQWQNLWNYDGTPQKPEGVKENANQD